VKVERGGVEEKELDGKPCEFIWKTEERTREELKTE
jgi:hypothetical protein